MMSAPSEMRWSEIPAYSMMTKVIASTRGMAIATTSPARMPRLTKLTASTIATASNRALVKPDTASSTTFGWSDTRCTPMPTGSSPSMRVISSCSASPKASRLAPDFMPTARPMAGSPLKRNRLDGGSA